MKNFISKYLVLSLFLLVNCNALANNISIVNVSLTGQNTTEHCIMVKFDISWENSWRTSSEPNNWDAAWVFVKYKVKWNYVSDAGATNSTTTITVTSTAGLRVGMPISVTAGTGVFATGTVVTAITNATTFVVSAAPTTALSGGAVVTGYAIWEHAKLNTTGHTAPTGSTITSASDSTGIFIYRSADGTGTFSASSTQLRWNYGINGIADTATKLDIQVFAIEMVYIPQGAFTIGTGGTETGSLTDGSWRSGNTIALSITSENALTIDSSAGNLWGTSSSSYSTIGSAGTLVATFPKGYAAFYCMKYEISQQQYVDFLNTLTYTQQATRTPIAPNSTLGTYLYNTYRHKIKIGTSGTNSTVPAVYATDYPYVACNYLMWSDLAAYLDWSGLRPMTELEFEKACRGTGAPTANEYAWGTIGVARNVYTLSNDGTYNEVIATNYNNSTNYVSAAGATSNTLTDYVSAAGATGTISSTTIIVGSTTGLSVGMSVSVTAGVGNFAAGTFVTSITDGTHFVVSAPPITALSGGASVITGCGAIITVSSTTGLLVGMPVSVTAGNGVFAVGTIVTSITDVTTFIVSASPTTILSNGTVITGYPLGNALYVKTGNSIGPFRVGIFAGTSGNTGRLTAGATYYGIMEMGGNLYERPVTLGNTTGRSFTGTHGNGTLDATGNANATSWPGTAATGTGIRGGQYNDNVAYLRVSDRTYEVYTNATRQSTYGGRGVRTAP